MKHIEAQVVTLGAHGEIRERLISMDGVSVFNTPLAVQNYLDRHHHDELAGVILPKRAPGILMVRTQQVADLFRTAMPGTFAVALQLPDLCLGRVFSYDLAVFPGRGAAYTRAGLVVRHKRAFSCVAEMDAADKDAAFPRVAMSEGVAVFKVRRDMLNLENSIVARRCFYTGRRFVELAPNIFLRLPSPEA